MRKLIGSAVLVLALAGCGTSGSNDATPLTSSAPPEAAADGVDPALGARYADLVGPANCVNEAFQDAAGDVERSAAYGDPAVVELQRLAKAAAKADTAFADGLSNTEWPAAIQPSIDDLIDEVETEAAWMQALGDADDEQSFADAIDAPLPERSDAATRVREALGLPSNVGADVDCSAAI